MADRVTAAPAWPRRRRRSAGRIALSRLSRALGESLDAAWAEAEGPVRPQVAPLPPALDRALASAPAGDGAAASLAETWTYQVSELELRFEALIDEATLCRALAGGDLWLFVPVRAPLLARIARWLARRFGRAPARPRPRRISIAVRPGEGPRLLIDDIPITPSKEKPDDQR